MKNLILILITFSSIVYGQVKMNEKRVIEEKHVDFTKEYIWFELSGLIEIDGHIFKNDTCDCPIIYTANLDGIKILDCNNIEYSHRTCSIKNCNTIHLVKKETVWIWDGNIKWQETFDSINICPLKDTIYQRLY